MKLNVLLNPLGEDFSTGIYIDVQPLIANYNHHVIERVADFFTIEEPFLIEDLAGTSIEALRSQAKTFIKYALNENEKMDLDIKINAPTVNIPVRKGTEEVLVIDLGEFEMRSDYSGKEEAVNIEKKDISVDNEYFYDSYTLKIKDVKAFFQTNQEQQQLIKNLQGDVKIHTRNIISSDIPSFKYSLYLTLISSELMLMSMISKY